MNTRIIDQYVQSLTVVLLVPLAEATHRFSIRQIQLMAIDPGTDILLRQFILQGVYDSRGVAARGDNNERTPAGQRFCRVKTQ